MLRSNALTIAVASFFAVGGLFAVSASSLEPSTNMQSAKADEMLQDAAAGVTFKIAASDVMAPMLAAGPLTGDGSN